MCQESLSSEVLQGTPTGRKLRNRPRTR